MMRASAKSFFAVVCALSVVACSGAAEEETTQEEVVEETAPTEATSDAAVKESTEVFEVCDEDGNRYPSEADAEAAGLDRAEYGATFCEYAE